MTQASSEPDRQRVVRGLLQTALDENVGAYSL